MTTGWHTLHPPKQKLWVNSNFRGKTWNLLLAMGPVRLPSEIKPPLTQLLPSFYVQSFTVLGASNLCLNS